ncbi:MAG: hypothetical protein ACHP65_03330 [Legionellales bacterium]
MPTNSLFNFIKPSAPQLEVAYYEGKRVELLDDHQGKWYIRVALPALRMQKLLGYSLLDHHISIYEKLFDRSQYHYTGYFADNQNTQYQLHVFFDEQDEIIDYSFSRKIIQMGAEVASSRPAPIVTEHNAPWINWALIQCGSLIPSLRVKLNQKTQTLEGLFTRLEEEASTLSIHAQQNHVAYATKLDDVRQALQQLIPLVQTPYYQQVDRLIKRMQVDLQRTVLLPVKKSSTPSLTMAAVATVVEVPEVVAEDEAKKPPMTRIDESIQTLITCFSAKPQAMTTQYASHLSTVHSEYHRLSLQLDEPDHFASPMAIRAMFVLQRQIVQAGVTLLHQSLAQNQFAVAAELRLFYHKLTRTHVVTALKNKQPQQLDFLINNSDFVLNGYPIEIDEVVYPSAVHYCFQHGDIDALAVLIKNGASIVVPDADGIPLAHKILSEKAYAFLRPALTGTEINQNKTITSIAFYHKLIEALTGCLAQKESAEYQYIKKAIVAYKHSLGLLYGTNHQPAMVKSTKEATAAATTSVNAVIANPEVNQGFLNVLADKDIIKLKNRLASLQQELRKKEQKNHISQFTGGRTLLNEQCMNLIADTLSGPMEQVSYQEIKEQTMSNLNELTALFQKKIEVMDIQKQLRSRVIGVHARISKEKRSLETRQSELNREIRALAIKHRDLIIDNKNSSQTQAPEGMNNGSGQIMLQIRKKSQQPPQAATAAVAPHSFFASVPNCSDKNADDSQACHLT